MHKMIRALAVVLICILLCLCGCTTTQTNLSDEKFLTVHVLSVGDAECIFVQLPDGKNLLIDGAEHWNADDIVAYLKELGVEKLDTVIASPRYGHYADGLR